MELILEVKRSSQKAVIGAIKRKRKIPKIRRIKPHSDKSKHYIIVTYRPKHKLDDDGEVRKEFGKIKGVIKVRLNQPLNQLKENMDEKNCHFIFDVDSTLTSGHGTIQNEIRGIFNKLKENGHRIYLASGRNMDGLRKDIEEFGAESYGIAENGGIILGLGRGGYLVIGDRTEPDKVLKYMKKRCKSIKEDIRQGMRLTERIFLATIKEERFEKYVENSKARVNILAGKNSYHVTQKKVDKGFALERLKTELRFGTDDMVIGVGDSDLDIPLFKKADYAFVVGNGSSKAKKHATNLKGNYAAGIRELERDYLK